MSLSTLLTHSGSKPSVRRGWRVGGVLALAVLTTLGGCSGEDPEEARFRQQLIEKALNDDTRRAGDAFLAQNAQQDGVQVTASGLQYRVLRPGSGERPGPLDTVVVNYEGTRIDGVVFDSSYARNKPSRFPLNRVIKGWSEGLQLMQVGEERMLYLPADLAYGAVSPAEDIPANSALQFRVELLAVEKVQPGSGEVSLPVTGPDARTSQ